MQTPEPVREHRELQKLAGHFAGPERMHPSYWNEEAKKAEAVTDARVALDGFAIVQDYEQRLEDGGRFAGHGVFRYDMASETYEMHWFDSTGGPERIFRGGFSGNRLVLTARAGGGWQRLTYDFNLRKGYRMKLETSEDGNRWKVALEGDNIAGRKAPARKTAAKRKTAGKKTARKAAAKKASPKKKAVAKNTARGVAKKKTSTRKAAAKKSAGRKAATKRTAPKRKATKKAGARKVASRKTATEKATAKGATAKKTSTRKASAGKSPAKKATAKKATARKVSAKKTPARKTVAEAEKQRRQGRASRKVGAKSHARANAGSAASTPVSQKRTKGAAHKGPRMPNLKSTSTRVGWHKTAAKGVRGR